MHRRIVSSLGALAALCGVLPLAAQAPAAAPAETPTLVVFFTVDQLRADYFEKYGSQLTGGLARLYEGGSAIPGFAEWPLSGRA